jgi:hypothetical protein
MPNEKTRQIQISTDQLKIISHVLGKEIADYGPIYYDRMVIQYVKMLKDAKVVIDYYL